MIQEIKDRVPVNVLSNDAIRYGIYDENSKLLRYEYIKREDEPTEEGTPINKVLFNNLQGDLYTQDRYNVPVVTSENGNFINNLSLPLTSYEVGKIVNIEGSSYVETTSFENPYLNINNLGVKRINGTIEAGKKYSLIYNGESWDIINNYVIGTYTGNGKLTQDIILGFKPKVVIITSASGRMGFQSGNSSAYTYVYGGIFMEGFPLANFAGDITENGFRVRYDESTSSNKPMTNSKLVASNPYRYIAFI